MRTKYKCCILHHCAKENKLTFDSYFIVKNIIFQILRTVPSLRNYLKLEEHNVRMVCFYFQFINEMMSVYD